MAAESSNNYLGVPETSMLPISNAVSSNKLIEDTNDREKQSQVDLMCDREAIQTEAIQTREKNTARRQVDSMAVDEDYEKIKRMIKNAVTVENPNVSFESIIGLEEAKHAIFEAVDIPTRYPASGQAKNSWRGILLFGPSGVGKTQMAKAVASKAGMSFVSVSADTLVSKWQGDTEKAVKAVFDIARERSPCIIFFDECDQFYGERSQNEGESSRRIKSSLLVEMDGIKNDETSNVIVIGNTNLPQNLDYGFLRRFPKKIFVDLPDQKERVQLLHHFLGDYNHRVSDSHIAKISSRLVRYSGADLKTLVAEAGLVQLKGDMHANRGTGSLRDILKEDFDKAMRSVKPSNKEAVISAMRRWNEEQGGISALYFDHEEIEKQWKKQNIVFREISNTISFFSGM